MTASVRRAAGWTPLVVLAVSLILTAIAWHLTKTQVELNARGEFEAASADTVSAIRERMIAYEEILRGGAALFLASRNVSREDWRRYVEQLELAEGYPGMTGMGFARRLEARDEYAVEGYADPSGRDGPELAADRMFSAPVSREAMLRARDSGRAALTSRLSLAGDAHAERPGFLVYVPVYGVGKIPGTAAERAAALRGYIFGAFVAEDVLRGLARELPADVGVELYDDARSAAHAPLASNDAARVQRERGETAAFVDSRTLEIAGQSWTLRFRSGPYERAVRNASQPMLVLAAGIPISLLFFAIAWSQSTLRARAQQLANEMTAELRKNAEERQRLEASLRQAQKLEAMGTLAGGIAHDFNNILGAILGYGELAENAAPPEGPLRRYLANVNGAALRAKSLVHRILAFSRSGLGERVPVHVQSVVSEALDLLSASLPTGVRIDQALNSEDAAIVGDPTQVHQVVMNLCTNALQAMKSGGVLTVGLDLVALTEPRTLATGALPPGDYVRLVVRDTGGGIPADTLPRIFDPFFTTKEVRVGTGLGLSLVHGIVTDLGGGVDVESDPGRGTAFTVLLPRHGRALQATPVREEIPRGTGETVLLVDDEEALVSLGEETIAGLGYEPVGFTSSATALAAFRSDPQRFAVVLSDEIMPGMTGSQLAEEIRKVRGDIPIVLMSGYGGLGLAARARAVGAADVLGKPLVARDIARCLARVLGKPVPY